MNTILPSLEAAGRVILIGPFEASAKMAKSEEAIA